jgi:hypothetical protein
MTYVTIVIALFVLAFGTLLLRVVNRRRALMQRMEEVNARQVYQLPRLEKLMKLFADKTRPVAGYEAEARALLAELRVSDVDGAIEPVIVHYESELAARR